MLCVELVNAIALLQKNIIIKPKTNQNKFSKGQFKRKTALITGGSTGIGRSAAEAMATEALPLDGGYTAR